MHRWGVFLLLTLWLLVFSTMVHAETLRPSGMPMVACDPYFRSSWSAEKLTSTDTTHSTSKPQTGAGKAALKPGKI
jgi:hypothetical protein